MSLRFPASSHLVMALFAVPGGVAAESPFASKVLDYAAAPGQWVNDARFSDPAAALGAPFPGGLAEPDEVALVSLGGFGGSIVLAFDHTVVDDPRNRFGMDAIVFGNAFLVGGDRNVHWAECATIEIALDENGNGAADDTWYLIPGSHLPDPASQFLLVTWDDDVTDDTYPPDLASWIPAGSGGTWTTAAYELPVDVFGQPVVTNPSFEPEVEGVFGYAEYSSTQRLGDLDGDGTVEDPTLPPEAFYTVPDDPLSVGVTAGSGGGDAFDIAWAIDPDTGLPAELPGFDFIRLTSAVDVVAGVLGEKSPEIDAVADAGPDLFGDTDDDGDIDLMDAGVFQVCFGEADAAAAECDRSDREPDLIIDLLDWAAMVGLMTGPE